MAKSLNFIIPLVVYPFDVMVSIAQSDKELHKMLKKYKLHDEPEHLWQFNNNTAVGRFCMFSNNGTLIRMRHYPKYPDELGTLTHEVFHAVMHIFNVIGMKWSPKTDEAYAYLVGYLMKEIYSNLLKK